MSAIMLSLNQWYGDGAEHCWGEL